MTDDLTMKYLRGYHSQSTLFDRNNIENWKRATNGRDSGTMATEMARSLIATHRPSVELSEDVIAEFDKIIAEAEAEVTADPKVVI